MSPEGYDRRQGLLGQSPGMRAWGNAHPAALAAVQGVVFGIVLGVIMAVTGTHRSLGSVAARAAIAGVIFGLFMWSYIAVARRWRTDRD